MTSISANVREAFGMDGVEEVYYQNYEGYCKYCHTRHPIEVKVWAQTNWCTRCVGLGVCSYPKSNTVYGWCSHCEGTGIVIPAVIFEDCMNP